MASMVIASALDHPPVTFALYGHPLVFSLLPFFVLGAAKPLGLRTKILPAVSSLDTIFVDLRIDPCTQGLQMYEATDLLLRRRPLQPDVPCLIWQIGAVETRLYSEASSQPDRFERIKEYLLRFYPPNTPMFAIYSASLPLVPPTMTKFTLDKIEDVADVLHQGVTVFIPPIATRSIEDQDLLVAMDEAVHLRQLTRSPLDP
jgi:uncharacterized protein YabN with tetrapyrrole methylase and pyrophosphatase domain